MQRYYVKHGSNKQNDLGSNTRLTGHPHKVEQKLKLTLVIVTPVMFLKPRTFRAT